MPTPASDVTVVHGLPEPMRADAVRLYDEAFGAKYAVAIPDGDQRLGLLHDALTLGFAFGAVVEGRLAGLAGYKTEAGALTDGLTYRALVRRCGVVRGTWAALVFSFYERGLNPGELLMDGIVVDAEMRGRGIGTLLLEAMAEHARSTGHRALRLDVIETNPDARRLYERRGFVPTETSSFGYLRWLLGFGASTTLIRDVSTSV
ncbi:MAG: GNAT family N-acetyltransferase [Bacteroidota bacterium]